MELMPRFIEICLSLMVFTLPFTLIPNRYRLPVLGGNIPEIFLLLAVIFFLVYIVYKKHLKVLDDKYFILFFVWSLLCLVWGCWKLPYYDNAVNESLRSSRMVLIVSHFIPGLMDNVILLHVKMFLSYFWYMIKGFFFPYAGMFFILSWLFKAGKGKEFKKYLYKGIYGLSILMVVYSIPEIIWLWTGNETCAWILSCINKNLYDPVLYNEWWPPLLWKGQLRSLCLEPSYFGIIVSFLLPCIAVDTYEKRKAWKIALIFCLVFMIFMTKARTATVIYFGESIVIILLSLIYRYLDWRKVLFTCVVITVGAFSIYLAGDSLHYQGVSTSELADKYVKENITSVVGKDKRSNSARFGNTTALIKIGLDYPVTGVGMGLHSPYMEDRIPEFAQDNYEVKNWIKDMHEKTFLKSGLPILNEYAALFAWEGLPGVLFFLFPLLNLMKRIIIQRRKKINFGKVGLLSALVGQLACMLSSEMFLTYPLILWISYCIFGDRENYE